MAAHWTKSHLNDGWQHTLCIVRSKCTVDFWELLRVGTCQHSQANVDLVCENRPDINMGDLGCILGDRKIGRWNHGPDIGVDALVPKPPCT